MSIFLRRSLRMIRCFSNEILNFNVTPQNLEEEITRVRFMELTWPYKLGERVDLEEVIFPIEYRKIETAEESEGLRINDLFCYVRENDDWNSDMKRLKLGN